jgi:enoyl-CoA hydratase/carnithine racemase
VTPHAPDSDVSFTVAGHVATIVLDRPAKLNAVTPAMADEVVEACRRCDADPEIRAVVLTGAGERAFCAGSDVAELDTYESAWAFRQREDYCDAVRGLRTPVICAVNGLAYGGGLELALSCDIRLAAAHATFAAPEIKLGWIGGGGMTYLLTHSIGASNAAQMILTGDPVDAERALRMGLVSELVPAADLAARAGELAAAIASRPPIAAQTGKVNLRAAYAMGLEAAVGYERDLQTICFATEDAAEGRAAFKERRPGIFRGS